MIATANAVRYCGATPVFVDSQPDTFNIDPEDIERRITPRTRGIIAVHLYGHPADMRAIGDIARRHAIFAVEDAAEAHYVWASSAPVRGSSLLVSLHLTVGLIAARSTLVSFLRVSSARGPCSASCE